MDRQACEHGVLEGTETRADRAGKIRIFGRFLCGDARIIERRSPTETSEKPDRSRASHASGFETVNISLYCGRQYDSLTNRPCVIARCSENFVNLYRWSTGLDPGNYQAPVVPQGLDGLAVSLRRSSAIVRLGVDFRGIRKLMA